MSETTESRVPDVAELAAQIGDPRSGPERHSGGLEVDTFGRLAELASWWHNTRPVSGAAAKAPAFAVSEPITARYVLDASAALTQAELTQAELTQAELTQTELTDAESLQRARVIEHLGRGLALADLAADEGAELLVLAVNDTDAAHVIAARLMSLDPMETLGWPDPDNDADWMASVERLRDGLWAGRELRREPVGLLTTAGAGKLASAVMLLLQAGVRRTPVLLDGTGALVAALMVQDLSLAASQWWQVAHAGDSALDQRLLDSLCLKPLLDLGIRAQDGTAGRLAVALIEQAAALDAAHAPTS